MFNNVIRGAQNLMAFVKLSLLTDTITPIIMSMVLEHYSHKTNTKTKPITHNSGEHIYTLQYLFTTIHSQALQNTVICATEAYI
jgi:hypothetical protein